MMMANTITSNLRNASPSSMFLVQAFSSLPRGFFVRPRSNVNVDRLHCANRRLPKTTPFAIRQSSSSNQNKNDSSQPDTTTKLHYSSNKNSKSNRNSISLNIPTPEDMEEVGAMFSAIVLEDYMVVNEDDSKKQLAATNTNRGDIFFLDGDLGAGKTSFSRGFLRASTGDEGLRVTSPTYLLVNVYPILGGSLEIHHMDLYRLSGKPEDLQPLNLGHVFKHCISLVEWPERLGNTNIPADRLDINIQIEGSVEEEEIRGSGQKSNINNDDEGEEDDKPRIMTLSPHGPIWEQRLQMILAEGYVDDLLL